MTRTTVTRNTVTVSMAVLGTVLLWSGFCALLSLFDEDLAEQPVCYIIKLISTAMLFCVSWTNIRNGDETRAMLLLIAGMSSMTTVIAWFSGYHADIRMLDIPFLPPLAIVAYRLWRKGGTLEFAGTATLAASIALGATGMYPAASASAFSLVASGCLFLASGIAAPSSGCTGNPTERKGAIYNRLCLCTMTVHALTTVLSSENVIDTPVDPVLLMIIAATAVGALVNGRTVSGTGSLVYSITCMTISSSVIEPGSACEPATSIAACVCMLCGLMSIAGKDRLFGIGLTVFPILLISSMHTDAAGLHTIGSIVLAAGAMAGIVRGNDAEPRITDPIGISAPSSAGLMVLAIALFTASAGISDAHPESYGSILFVECLAVLAFSVISMRSRMITESVLFLFSGTFMMTVALANPGSSSSIYLQTNVFVCIGTVLAAVVYLISRDVSRSAGCALLSMAIVSSAFPGGESAFVASSAASGFMFLLVALKKTVKFGITNDAKIADRYNLKQSDYQYSRVLCMTVALLMLLIFALMSESGAVLSVTDPRLNIFNTTLLLASVGFGIYTVNKGVDTSGMFTLVSAIIGILGAVFPLYGIHMPYEIRLISATALLPISYCFLRSNDFPMFVTSAICIMSLSVGPLLERSDLFDIMGIAVKTVIGLTAVTLWIEYDTGKQVIPRITRYWRKDLMSGEGTRDNRSPVLTCGIFVSAIMMMWAGAAIISDYDDLLPFELSMALVSAISACFCVFLFRTGSIVHGSLFLTMSACMLGCSIPPILGLGFVPGWEMTLLFVPPAFMSAASGLRGTALLAVTSAAGFGTLLAGAPDVVSGAIFLAAGISMLPWVCHRMVFGVPGFAPSGDLVASALLTAGTFSLLAALTDSDGLAIPSMVLSVFACAAAMHKIGTENLTCCLLLLATSLSALAFGPLEVADAGTSMLPMVFVAIFVLIAAAAAKTDGDMPGAAICALSGSVIAVSIVAGFGTASFAGYAVLSLLVLAYGLRGVVSSGARIPAADV